jgi:cellulose synthase (UDP-forming)
VLVPAPSPIGGRLEEKITVERFRAGREAATSLIGVFCTLVATTLVLEHAVRGLIRAANAGLWTSFGAHLLVTGLAIGLVYGALVYLLARWAWARRLHAASAEWAPAAPWPSDGSAPAVTILVPAYKEEPEVVAMTLMSAAVQDYPVRRIVLLLDDPPDPASGAEAERTQAMRRVVSRLGAEFADARMSFERQRTAFGSAATEGQSLRDDIGRVSRAYVTAAMWVQARIDAHPRRDHVDTVYLDKVLTRYRDRLLEDSLRVLSAGFHEHATVVAIAGEYDRLVDLFTVDVTVFERKRYDNLSHEPNKAMNINAYLGLMGGRYAEAVQDGMRSIEPSPTGATLVPWTPYVMTLDADSLVLPDYASRLIRLLEADGNERMAVAQTPYSAFPGAPTAIERIAGATTDIQYIIHQGFTGFGATYWVGANAVLRRSALEDIATTASERGHRVRRYIQDATVIEDTESTIDLVRAGWRLLNYPERLAYSATPRDFGSLLIQRGRWANGGLLILPKLLRLMLARGPARPRFLQSAMRAHYLVSIALVNVALVALLAFPLPDGVISPFLPLTAAPYYLLYARDLRLVGYRVRDVVGVYALNLLLIPVNLGGVLASVLQGLRRTKTPFLRTPKVLDRTAAPAAYLALEVALAVWWVVGGAFSLAQGRLVHGAFSLVHALVLIGAVTVFIGTRALAEDIRLQWLPKRSALAAAPPAAAAPMSPATSSAAADAAPVVAFTALSTSHLRAVEPAASAAGEPRPVRT